MHKQPLRETATCVLVGEVLSNKLNVGPTGAYYVGASYGSLQTAKFSLCVGPAGGHLGKGFDCGIQNLLSVRQ